MAKKLLEPSTLLPCMVVIVTCMGNDGKPNMSTISEGGVLSNEPPILGISVNKAHASYKQIKETMEFVINIPPETLLWETDVVGCISGRKKDKFELMQGRLTPIPSQVVKVPSLKECPVNIECKVKSIIGLGSEDLFIAQVVANVADEEVLKPGAFTEDHIAFNKPALDIGKIRPLLNIHGGGHYWNIKDELEPLFYSYKKKK